MNKGTNIILAIVALLFFGASHSYAQQKTDTTRLQKSAIEYAFPERFAWQGGKFEKKGRFIDRTYLSFAYGYSGLFNNKETYGSVYQIAMGTWLAPVHGLEAAINLHTPKRGKNISSYDLNYMFNITSFSAMSEKPGRVTLLLKSGVSAMVREGVSFGLSTSLRAQYNLSPGVGLYMEPKISIYDNNISSIYTSATVASNIVGGIYGGLSVNLGAWDRQVQESRVQRQAEAIGERPFEVALKTNLLYGIATFTPNLGIEVGLGRKTSIELMGSYNWINMNGKPGNNKKLAHWMVSPEFKYYTQRRFDGLYVGTHLIGTAYNIGNHYLPLLFGKDSKDHRYEGYGAGAGISAGYMLPLTKRLNLEFNVGVGYMRMEYDKWEHPRCGSRLDTDVVRHYIGPTKAGIKLMVIL